MSESCRYSCKQEPGLSVCLKKCKVIDSVDECMFQAVKMSLHASVHRLAACRHVVSLVVSRNIGISAVCCQKATAAVNLDPIQKLFIDKIHEYAQKSK